MNTPQYIVTVSCPKCGHSCAWLGDQGACVDLYGRCLTCLLFSEDEPSRTEEELDAMAEEVVRLRQLREESTGRRIFPCVWHAPSEAGVCPQCSGRGWVVGYPPGKLPPS